jgi:hypothetical protein
LKLGILLGLVSIVFLTGSIFATQASAQYPSQGGQNQFQGTRTPVNGTYTSSDFGVHISIPDGWSGSEIKRTTGSTVMLAPGGLQQMQAGQRPPVLMMISILPKNSTSSAPQLLPRNIPQGETCNNSTSTKIVNSISLNEVMVDCSGSIMMKVRYDMAQTDSAYIILGYRANPSSGFDSQVSTFDNMIKTLQITKPTQAAVVPEFPVPIIGLMIVILVGTIVILGRTKLVPNGI